MSNYNSKNYVEQGGSRTVIGGVLDIVGDGKILRNGLPLEFGGVEVQDKVDRLETATFTKHQVTNIIPNPNFSNAASWPFVLSSGSASNGTMTFTATQSLGQCRTAIQGSTVVGHVFYMGCYVTATSNLVRLDLYRSDSGASYGTVDHPGSGTAYLSGIAVPTAGVGLSFRVIDYRTSGWSAVSFTQPFVVNLTLAFGAGNEPSKDEFERMLAQSDGSSDVYKMVDSPNTAMPLFVKRSGDWIDVISKYDNTRDIRIRLGRRGGNNLFDFSKIFMINNTSKSVSSDTAAGTQFFESFTDWFSPHQLTASANANGDKPGVSGFFTGGNHAYSGGASGSATARTLGVSLHVDGRKVTNFEGRCNFVDIYWSNRVQAMNTIKEDGSGREVMQENFHMHFDGYEWYVDCTFEILEALSWGTCYGLQCSTGPWGVGIFYHSATNRKWNALNVDSTSGGKTCDKMTLRSVNNDYLDLCMSPTSGLGSREFLISGSQVGAFTRDYGKSYFNLIEGANVFTTGELLSYEGSYRFYSKA